MKNKYFTMDYQEGDKTAEIYIFGDITSWPVLNSDVSSHNLAQRIQGLPADVAITVHVNSNGGEVKEGLAIYNVLKGRDVTTVCDGFAASAASVVFCAGKTRIMNAASLLFVHQAIMLTCGNADQLEKDSQDLRKITESAVAAYQECGVKLSEEEIWELLKQEAWISPQEALDYGFATQIAEKEEDDTIKNDAMQSIMAAVLKKTESDTGATVDLQGIGDKLDEILEKVGAAHRETSPSPVPAMGEHKGFFGFRRS